MATGYSQFKVHLCTILAICCYHSIFFMFQQAEAFNVQALEAASMTTLSGLSATASQALRRLLNGKDLADVVGWAERVAEKYPDTRRLHFLQQPSCPKKVLQARDVVIDTSACRNHGNCLLEAITFFFFQLVDPVRNTTPSKDKDVMTTTDFVFPHDITPTDADAVKYMINLIGALHSPLHLGSADDNFGKSVVVQYHDGENMKLTSFYNYNENVLVEKTVQHRQYFWYSGWTHVNSIKSTYEAEKLLFQENKEKMFMRWAAENYAILCNELYPQLRKTGKDARAAAKALGAEFVDEYAQAAINAAPPEDSVTLYEIVFPGEFTLFEILKKRILLSGARVAIVMNHILQVREQKDLGRLRQGSGVADVVETVDPPYSQENKALVYLKNFLINLAIFFVILLIFMYISRFYSSPPAHASVQRGAAPALAEQPGASPMRKLVSVAATACTGGVKRSVEMESIKDS